VGLANAVLKVAGLPSVFTEETNTRSRLSMRDLQEVRGEGG
jgi:hypothetical protein